MIKVEKKSGQALSRFVKITCYHIRNDIKNLYVRKKSYLDRIFKIIV